MDNSDKIKTPFDRVAYFVELDHKHRGKQHVFVSFKTMTNDIKKIGIPDFRSGAVFQQMVDDMEIVSNVSDLKTGRVDQGNIEFWPYNYSNKNQKNVPGADDKKFDFGDQCANGQDYGSMQVHNYKAKQTVFAINCWKAGQKADLGIGNCKKSNRGGTDWTFKGNAKNHNSAKLRVLIRPSQ